MTKLTQSVKIYIKIDRASLIELWHIWREAIFLEAGYQNAEATKVTKKYCSGNFFKTLLGKL